MYIHICVCVCMHVCMDEWVDRYATCMHISFCLSSWYRYSYSYACVLGFQRDLDMCELGIGSTCTCKVRVSREQV